MKFDHSKTDQSETDHSKMSHGRTASLRCSRVSMFRDQLMVLRDINLDVQANEKVAILGPNGAGKTSLLQVLAGHFPTGGQVLLEDKALAEYSKSELSGKLAMVHQQEPEYQNQRIVDVVRLGLLPSKRFQFWDTKSDHQRLSTILDQFSLSHLQNRLMVELSGGEKQRVQLARAALQNTPIILLDEPTSHLDVSYQHELMWFIQNLKKTVVVTLHDINLALRYFSRLILLDKGQIIFDGSADELPQSKALEKVYRLPLRFWHGTTNGNQSLDAKHDSGTLQVEFLRDDP